MNYLYFLTAGVPGTIGGIPEEIKQTGGLIFLPLILFFLFFGLMVTIIVRSIVNNSKKKKEQRQRIETMYFETVEKYYQIIVNDSELNALRSRIKKTHIIGLCMIVFGFITFFILNIISLIIVISGVFIMNSKKSEYQKIYKERIMKNALYEYDKDFDYYPTGSIPQQQYNMAEFECYDRYFSEDRINGKISGLNFIMADVHVQYRRRDSDGDTHYVTLFNGPVAILELPTKVKSDISIVNNKLKSFATREKVEIDNPQFEEMYDVYCVDKIWAMKLLTPSVTTKFIDIFTKYGFRFELKIIENYMYFRFHSGNLFIPNPNDAREEAVGVALYFEILEGIKKIMNEVIVTMKKL